MGFFQKYPKVTFDKEVAFKNNDAEFISFGHPLFESIMDLVENELQNLSKQVQYLLTRQEKDGVILYHSERLGWKT